MPCTLRGLPHALHTGSSASPHAHGGLHHTLHTGGGCLTPCTLGGCLTPCTRGALPCPRGGGGASHLAHGGEGGYLAVVHIAEASAAVQGRGPLPPAPRTAPPPSPPRGACRERSGTAPAGGRRRGGSGRAGPGRARGPGLGAGLGPRCTHLHRRPRGVCGAAALCPVFRPAASARRGAALGRAGLGAGPGSAAPAPRPPFAPHSDETPGAGGRSPSPHGRRGGGEGASRCPGGRGPRGSVRCTWHRVPFRLLRPSPLALSTAKGRPEPGRTSSNPRLHRTLPPRCFCSSADPQSLSVSL